MQISGVCTPSIRDLLIIDKSLWDIEEYFEFSVVSY